MPARFWILRIIVGLMCIGFAYFLGRSIARKGAPARRGTGTGSWALRTALAGMAVLWRSGLDPLAIGVYAAALVSGAAGFFRQRLPADSQDEDLAKKMFPDE